MTDTIWPRIAVVVLNYNTKELLERFMPSIMATAYPNMYIVLADNASTDGSSEFVKQNYPQITLLQLEKNLGYAGGYNEALKRVQADYYVLLNSDVEVPSNWLMPLVTMAMRDPKYGAIQPKIKDFKDKNLFEYAGAAGGFIDWLGYPFCRGRVFDTVEQDVRQYDADEEIFWASGACMMVKSEVFHKLNGFDPHFFAHMEEIDLCWRMQSRGFKIMYCHDSEVYHIGGGTLSQQHHRKTYLNFRNGLRLIIKNYPNGKLFRVMFLRMLLDGVAGIQFLIKGRHKDTVAILKAHRDLYLELGTWLKYRETNRKLTWKELNNLPGFYSRSLVWQYFVKKRQRFVDLF